MKITKKAKTNFILILCAVIFVVLVLFSIIIWQTVKVNNLNAEINKLDGQIAETNEQISRQDNQIEYYESEQFKEDYVKYELGYADNKFEIYQ